MKDTACECMRVRIVVDGRKETRLMPSAKSEDFLWNNTSAINVVCIEANILA